MVRFVVAIVLTCLVTVFAVGNMHRVEICPFLGEKLEIRAFFLMLSSFLVGCLSTALVFLYINVRSDRARRDRGAASRDDDEDEFFS